MRDFGIALACALGLSACSSVDLLPADVEAVLKAVACSPEFDGDWEAVLKRPLGERERAFITTYRAIECPAAELAPLPPTE